MRKLFALFLIGLQLVAPLCAQQPGGVPQSPVVLIFTPPINQPANCSSLTASGYWCGFRTVMSTSYVGGVSIGIPWNSVETSQGIYQWNLFDQTIQDLTGFNATLSCTTGTVTATLSSSIGGSPLFQTGQQIVTWNNSTGGFNGTFVLTSGGTTTVQWAQACPGASATSGFVASACGGARCKFDLNLVHSSYGGNNTSTPTYVFTPAWATSCCSSAPVDVIFDNEYYNGGTCAGGIPIWQPSTGYQAGSYVSGLNAGTSTCTTGSVQNTNSHVYLLTSGNCTSQAGSSPAMNTAGGSTTEGTCTWKDQGFGIAVNANSSSPTITNAVLASGHAAGWEAPWLAAWKNLAQSAIAHYAGVSWASQILNFRWGLVVGGERYLFGSKTASTFLFSGSAAATRSAWLTALGTTDGYVKTFTANNSAPWGNMAVGNGCTAFSANNGNLNDQTWTDAEYLEGFVNGFNLGTEGVQTADVANLALGYKCVTSPGPGTGNDYAYATLLYGSRIQWFEMQTTQQSCPTGASDCNGSETQTGSLTQLLPFATQHRINLLELYAGDFLCAELSVYTGPPTFAECGATSPTYHQTILNFTTSSAFTSAIVGNAGLVGNAAIQ